MPENLIQARRRERGRHFEWARPRAGREGEGKSTWRTTRMAAARSLGREENLLNGSRYEIRTRDQPDWLITLNLPNQAAGLACRPASSLAGLLACWQAGGRESGKRARRAKRWHFFSLQLETFRAGSKPARRRFPFRSRRRRWSSWFGRRSFNLLLLAASIRRAVECGRRAVAARRAFTGPSSRKTERAPARLTPTKRPPVFRAPPALAAWRQLKPPLPPPAELPRAPLSVGS